MNLQIVPFICEFEVMSSETEILAFQMRFNTHENHLHQLSLKIQDHSMSPRIHRSEQWIIEYSNYEFFMMFRMEQGTLEKLEQAIGNVDKDRILQKPYTGGHHPIESRLQIMVFLYYMATQETLFSIGKRFKVSTGSVHNIINRLLYLVLFMKNRYIRFPQSDEEMEEIAKDFKKYPGTVGALDGTHVFIKVEKEQQDSFIDRYRRHSINLMAICNASKVFLYVFIGFPGSAHDSRVFEHSNLYKEIVRFGSHSIFGKKYHLVGDSAFGVKEWLMTPYRDSQIRKEKHHNYCLSSERVVIEHSFGLLKGRWRRLQFVNTYNIFKTVEITTAACILHNFCFLYNDLWDEGYYDQRVPLENAGGDLGRNQNQGKIKRNFIADQLFANRN